MSQSYAYMRHCARCATKSNNYFRETKKPYGNDFWDYMSQSYAYMCHCSRCESIGVEPLTYLQFIRLVDKVVPCLPN